MTQEALSAALDKASKLEWHMRLARKLSWKVEALSARDAIRLMKRIESVLDGTLDNPGKTG